MKVLHIAETSRGGCGTYLNEILPLQIERLGAENLRCIVPAQHGMLLSEVPAGLVRSFDRPTRKAGLLPLARVIRRELREWQPDVIHAHSTFAGAIVRLMSLTRPMPPIVYCAHGWVFDVARGPVSRALAEAAERLLAYRAQRIIAISQAERRAGQQAGIPSDKLVVVPNGIGALAPTERAAWDDTRIKLLFVGRLDRQKGVDVLLQAVRGLEDRVVLRIVGEAVVAGAEGQGAAEPLPHVEYLGWQDKAGVAAQMNACDAVVMPSRWEGFGLVAVEAMRAGKTVLASAVGGLVEIVVDGETGRLLPPEDAPALREVLQTIDAETLARMGRAGHERFLARFTSDRTHEGLMQVYAEALRSSPQAASLAAAAQSARRIG